MNNGVRIESETIKNLSKNIVSESEKLMQMIETARSKVENSKSIYDAPAAQEFRNKMDEFAENTKKDAGASLQNLANYFEAVASTYDQQDQDVADVANQYLSTDIFGE